MQVALHVTMRPNGAKASNRVSVSGGVSGLDDSQEALSQDSADGGSRGTSSSTPDLVGKANKKRAGQPRSKGAGAPRTSKRENVSPAPSWWKRWLLIASTACFLFNCCSELGVMRMQMSVIRISAAGGWVDGVPHASMQVALHVTMRQNGAKASNRVSVSGGVSGLDDSQEALSQDSADGGFFRWLGRLQRRRHT
jgi:hypothetical protein